MMILGSIKHTGTPRMSRLLVEPCGVMFPDARTLQRCPRHSGSTSSSTHSAPRTMIATSAVTAPAAHMQPDKGVTFMYTGALSIPKTAAATIHATCPDALT
eukprot:gnl/TRDRNA2_/TRDRNA2_174937_c12_seq32.p1 gnl/TRDRNA2_/TRDRNA2_174937_c12~~gnl/TRDRNA2_/TRDRNA2_174937_c12_seq32.p1  ORF type:complete len:101 (-),score=0.54 gnl/TRDRNA2_/TRDRNA2_174937_c12_seq32:70-372(-)